MSLAERRGTQEKWRALKGFGISRRGDSNPVPIWIGDSSGGGFEYLDWAWTWLGGVRVLCAVTSMHPPLVIKQVCIRASDFSTPGQLCQSPEHGERS